MPLIWHAWAHAHTRTHKHKKVLIEWKRGLASSPLWHWAPLTNCDLWWVKLCGVGQSPLSFITPRVISVYPFYIIAFTFAPLTPVLREAGRSNKRTRWIHCDLEHHWRRRRRSLVDHRPNILGSQFITAKRSPCSLSLSVSGSPSLS